MKTLYYGDNLDVMREYIRDNTVDLIYLDPPFNSKRIYNVYFGANAQIRAFEDTWQYNEETISIINHFKNIQSSFYPFFDTLNSIIGNTSLMAYLVMMAVRIIEFKRILKDTGSLYLHCDPTAVHYLKILLDIVFKPQNFQNQIVWQRTSAHNDTKGWCRNQDNILFYTKTDNYTWNKVFTEYSPDYKANSYRYLDSDGRRFQVGDLTGSGVRSGESGKEWRGIDPTLKNRHWALPQSLFQEYDLPKSTLETLDFLDSIGRIYWPGKGEVPRIKRYLDEMPGNPIQEIITDINPLSSKSKEKLGYPTQKPLMLLERIILASSNAGDLVLDPFCGCGTALEAAEKLGREWIGIDITHLSIALVEQRLNEGFKNKIALKSIDGNTAPLYEVVGTPKDLESAADLARRDKFQFQFWACSLVRARPLEESKKGADKGIDGVIYFRDDDDRRGGRLKKIIISVKGGENIGPAMIRDLRGVIDREDAVIGLFITLKEPSKAMKTEAAEAGVYTSPNTEGKFRRIQILTMKEILSGKKPDLPPDFSIGAETMKKNRLVYDKPKINTNRLEF